MKQRFTSVQQQDRNLLIFLIVVGYIVTFITAARGRAEYSALQVVAGILLGVGYLVLALFDTELLKPFPSGWRDLIYFSVQIALVFGIGWTLETGGTPYNRLSDWMGWVTLVGMVGFSVVTSRKQK